MNPAHISAQMSAIPDGLMSSKKQRIMPVSVRNVAVPSTSGAQNAGGQLLFTLSSPNGYVKPGSMYLRLKVTLLNGIANGGAASFVAFGNTVRSASSLLDRLTINCGAVLESIQNYGSSYVPTLLLHAGSQAYLQGDDGLQEGGKRYTAITNTDAAPNTSVLANRWVDLAAGATQATVQATNTSIDVAIPIFSNLFQADQAYPLALQNSPTTVQIDLAQFGKAFSIGPTALYSDYQVTNAQLVYDLIIPSPEYTQALKAEMASGMLYSMPFVSSLGTQFAKNSDNITYSWATGLSSLLGVTYSCQVAPNTVTDPKYLMSDNAIGNPACSFRLMIDGIQQNTVVLDTSSVRYSELAKVFGLLGDTSRTSSSAGALVASTAASTILTTADYETFSFVSGINCMKISDGALAFSGTAANQVQLMLQTTANTASLVVVNAWHQRILVIDAGGNCSIVL